MEDEKVVISSLVVEARPESVDAVARALAAMEGVEVHEVNGYKIVVTIEASSTGASHEISEPVHSDSRGAEREPGVRQL